jgi:hypothetical protein
MGFQAQPFLLQLGPGIISGKFVLYCISLVVNNLPHLFTVYTILVLIMLLLNTFVYRGRYVEVDFHVVLEAAKIELMNFIKKSTEEN